MIAIVPVTSSLWEGYKAGSDHLKMPIQIHTHFAGDFGQLSRSDWSSFLVCDEETLL